jgi:putative hemolysin
LDVESGSPGPERPHSWWRAVFAWTLLAGILAVPAALAQTPGAGELGHGEFPWVALAAIVPLLFASAYFSASEVAFSSLHPVRLRGMALENGVVGPLIARMMQHKGQLLSTILIGNLFANVLIAVLMPPSIYAALRTAGLAEPVALTILTIVVSTFILVLVGEISPKVIAQRVTEQYCRAAAVPLRGCEIILAPVRWTVLHITELVFRMTGLNDVKPAPFITDDEFRTVLNDSEQQGVIESEEGQMIQAILQIGDRMVREILVPRPDVIAIDARATVSEAIALFREQEYSRMPMYTDDLDHVTGILFAKDLLPKLVHGQGDTSIRSLARRVEFVPETMNIRDFVRFAQRHRVHLAIVVDEYGGTAGIVTLEDAIEEVVGDIFDESDQASKAWRRLRKGVYRVRGSMSLEDLTELLHVPINDEEHNTVAGFVMDQLKRVPGEGDRLEYGPLVLTVERIDGRRIESIVVEKQPAAVKNEAS